MAKWVDHIKAAKDNTLVVLPLGATEQHGQHLPLQTDTLIVKGLCDRLIKGINERGTGAQDIRFLPPENVTYSPEHMDVAGSQTLTFDAAINRWIKLGQAAFEQGARRFVILNAHGGNSPLMAIVTQELRVRFSMLAVATSWTRFIKQSGIVSRDEEAFGIHGGDIETSVMLALAPSSVDMARADNFDNLQQRLAEKYTHLRAYGPHAFGWKAADLNLQGVTGNAAQASAAKGEALLTLASQGFMTLLDEVADFDLSLLKDAAS